MWISKYFAGFHLQLDCLCLSFRRGLYLKVAWEYKPDPESKDRMPGKRCIHASMYVPAGRLQLHQANPLECANHHLFAAAVLQAISARLKRAGILGEEHGEMRSAARAKTPAGSARIGPQTQPRRPAGRARRNRGHLRQQRLRAQGAPRPPPLASRTAPPPPPVHAASVHRVRRAPPGTRAAGWGGHGRLHQVPELALPRPRLRPAPRHQRLRPRRLRPLLPVSPPATSPSWPAAPSSPSQPARCVPRPRTGDGDGRFGWPTSRPGPAWGRL